MNNKGFLIAKSLVWDTEGLVSNVMTNIIGEHFGFRISEITSNRYGAYFVSVRGSMTFVGGNYKSLEEAQDGCQKWWSEALLKELNADAMDSLMTYTYRKPSIQDSRKRSQDEIARQQFWARKPWSGIMIGGTSDNVQPVIKWNDINSRPLTVDH